MNEKRNVPVPGEFYRHFKNRIYQIVTIAYHSETGEPMVVYQALYGDYKIWVRPLAMFMEKVDKEKYPEARQEYRFEPFTPSEGESGEDTGASDMENAVSPNPYLMEFLDAEVHLPCQAFRPCDTKRAGRHLHGFRYAPGRRGNRGAAFGHPKTSLAAPEI